MGKKHGPKRKPKSGLNRTPLEGHHFAGGVFTPPLARLPKMSPASWMNDRLPEMLWACLIHEFLGRDKALDCFRRIFVFIAQHTQKELLADITLTGISKLPEQLRKEFIWHIIEPSDVKQALAPLRLFDSLPAKDEWRLLLPNLSASVSLLMSAVGKTLFHQSQEATDCRWLRLMPYLITGQFQMPPEMVKELQFYPNLGDQRMVRPMIRSSEINVGNFDGEISNSLWSKSFWAEAWEKTPCLELVSKGNSAVIPQVITVELIDDVSNKLREHWHASHSTTAIDAKHDGVFGMAFYVLRIFSEIHQTGNEATILGRLGLRSILETRINLGYLLKKNESALWEKWRKYGAGQAKLSAVKFDFGVNVPKYIDLESVEQIANEDVWDEFLPIKINHWCDLDLRKLSVEAGLKEIYDQHYSWTSAYSHGVWGPVREACLTPCGNPLHRLHRYPKRKVLPGIVDDAASLVDAVLEALNGAYPSFTPRLLKP